MPKSTDAEKVLRTEAIQAATQYATEVPLRTMRVAYSAFDLLEAMAKDGNPNSLSDAGVGALAIRSAVYGAYMNVLINSADLKDLILAGNLTAEAQAIFEKTKEREISITDSIFKILKSRR
ncbi:Methenyltetrahydrofolate cyclohydrolase [bioreactor metagenome]|uniref:Methenyltetrahydrofolate cyclohydrolase n=1 Tax=bioreactor metagenome TaxID=1076179 RepID=A0A645BKY4_9ZZZZ